jgi:large subunit ribosomal protein L30|tara:strand:- start:561 stop:815 length:255 start_codon:yes stop_codon:yes gene_type:complete
MSEENKLEEKTKEKKSSKKPKAKKLPEVELTLVRSVSSANSKQKLVLRGLGLKKINQSVMRNDTPELRGMTFKVKHMITLKEKA